MVHPGQRPLPRREDLMSSLKVEVFRPVFDRHPDTGKLGVVRFRGSTVVCHPAEFARSELVAYVPIDAVVPNTPIWAFVGRDRRVKPRRFGSVLSQGVLVPGQPHWREGDDVAAELGVVKWEPPLWRE